MPFFNWSGNTDGGASSGTDNDAIHDNVANEISDIDLKVTPVSGDLLVIEDSASSNVKKKITVGSLPTAGGGEANTASNVGTGVGVFKQKTGVDLEFKSLTREGDVVVNSNTSDVTIQSAHMTGLISGGVLSVNGGDASKFDLAEGIGIIVNHTIPDVPVVTRVPFGPFTAVTVTNLPTQSYTPICIDSAGAIVQHTDLLAPDKPDIQRSELIIGLVSHENFTTISSVTNQAFQSYAIGNSLLDFFTSMGPQNTSGNVFSPNGANLNIDKSAGEVFAFGIHSKTDSTKPNTASSLLDTVAPFNYVYRDGSGGSTVTVATTSIDPDNVDDNSGTLVPLLNNKFTIQRFYMVTETFYAVEYGQNIYNSMDEASSLLPTEAHVVSSLLEHQLFRGWLIVRKGTTDLTDLTDARFIAASNISGSGSGGIDSSAIHKATSGELAAMTVKGTPVSADLLVIEDSADSNSKKTITIGTLPTAGGGEANTASSAGGTSLIKTKVGTDLPFKGLTATSTKISLSENPDDIGFDINESNLTLATPTVKGVTTSFLPTVKSSVHTVTNANYTVLDSDGFGVFLFSTGGTNRTLTLPTASDNEGRIIECIKTDTGVGQLIMDGEGSESINGRTTQRIFNQYGSCTLCCNGTSWFFVRIILENGTYLPTHTNVTAMDSVSEDGSHFFNRVGDTVHVWGKLNWDASSAGGLFNAARQSLPIAAQNNFTNNGGMLSGNISGAQTGNTILLTGNIKAFNSGSTNEAVIECTNFLGTTTQPVWVQFNYDIYP